MNTFSTKIKLYLLRAFNDPTTTFTVIGSLILIAFLQYTSRHTFVDADAFYHGRMASLTEVWRSAQGFHWLQNTTLFKDFADQQYLFHILLKPFDSPLGLHIATTLCASINILAFLYTLYTYKISWKPLWLTLYISGSATFLLRLNLVKAVPLFSALLLITLCAIHRKHVRPLVYLGLIAVLLYGGFILLPLFAIAYTIISYIYTKRVEYKPILFLCIGMGIGFVLHPYHAALPRFLWQQIVESGLQLHAAVEQGYEWLPYRLHDGMQDILLFIPWGLAMYGAIKALLYKKIEPHLATTIYWLGILSIGIFFVMLKSGRYIEYWVPFSLLFCGVVWSALYGKVLNQMSVRNVLQASVYKKVLYGCIGIGTIILLAKNVTVSFLALTHGTPTEQFKPAAEWLMNNTTEGSKIWNTQWDEFPQLFYWNTHNTYVVGLDPMFMYLKNREDYVLYASIANENLLDPGTIHHTLQNVFHTQYIFLENFRNTDLKHVLSSSPEYFSLRFEDRSTSIYQLKP